MRPISFSSKPFPPEQQSVVRAIRDDCAHAHIARLERSLRDRNALMARAGHDLKQPLQIILRAIEHLAPSAPTPMTRKWFDAALQQVGRLANGLTELALASLANEEAEWIATPAPFCIASVMDEIEANWALPAAEKRLDLRFVYCSQFVASDRRMLITILDNLVGNAVKHCDYGRILIGCRTQGEALRVDVIDTGPGIADADRPHIFQAGERGSSRKQGMGLGLALASTLCAKLALTIEMDSKVGHGSRFSITLPRLP